ncbi:DUF2073 domain-containing protein [Candidatus Woesearchaeota archaeon]|nr:DUF2073 domain-containing protein [Candidatus Woesearchaeota archaeon]
MLTLQYIPLNEIENLDSQDKIKKLLSLVKEDKILLVEGRLTPAEEVKLIESTMEEISKSFKGIEICTVYPQKKREVQFFSRLRKEVLNILGYRQGITIIGPASIIKDIKRDPTKIELLTRNSKKFRRMQAKK